ncbi:hypothetical protein GGTG_06623 [Gaeumannomyces tritici R3-111a-1]|uniref:Uncharacterized protein n=1 Tax=Gaeumannomyces tritici (strain R3-111a-1) TaxID=644352 RepID=J3NZC4_GAET3|nr:hypothetical protein GGTG_06623 [Gaeumannomyces tritici R3-111a-1]EJT76707.1 hypothetical protein GGTG_06623 [Gaeumannomyces tritici R3-111a-1]
MVANGNKSTSQSIDGVEGGVVGMSGSLVFGLTLQQQGGCQGGLECSDALRAAGTLTLVGGGWDDRDCAQGSKTSALEVAPEERARVNKEDSPTGHLRLEFMHEVMAHIRPEHPKSMTLRVLLAITIISAQFKLLASGSPPDVCPRASAPPARLLAAPAAPKAAERLPTAPKPATTPP